MGPKKLTKSEISALLKGVPKWSLKGGKLHRDFEFSDFITAFGFMTKAAFISEKQDHHPEWFNVYNRVSIDLSTHDCKGLSLKDFEWAKALDQLDKGR